MIRLIACDLDETYTKTFPALTSMLSKKQKMLVFILYVPVEEDIQAWIPF